jgi:hypothetical protein
MLDTERREVYGPLADQPLENIFGSDRAGKAAIRVLKKASITTIGMLVVRSKDELQYIDGLGNKTLLQIRDALADRELYLREEWRSKLTAIRYTYEHPPMAPASVVLPLRAYSLAAMRTEGMHTLNDFRGYTADKLWLWRHGLPPVFLPYEHASAVKVLVGLRIIPEPPSE